MGEMGTPVLFSKPLVSMCDFRGISWQMKSLQWFQRQRSPGGVFGGLEQRRCGALEWFDLDPGTLHCSASGPLHKPFSLSGTRFLPLFLWLIPSRFSGIRTKISLGKLSPNLRQASLLPEQSNSFRSAMSKRSIMNCICDLKFSTSLI